MPTVNLAHAKAHLSELLDDLLAGGEKVVITRHGRAVAEVLAVTRPKQPLRPLSAFRAAGPGWSAASADLLREGRDESL